MNKKDALIELEEHQTSMCRRQRFVERRLLTVTVRPDPAIVERTIWRARSDAAQAIMERARLGDGAARVLTIGLHLANTCTEVAEVFEDGGH